MVMPTAISHASGGRPERAQHAERNQAAAAVSRRVGKGVTHQSHRLAGNEPGERLEYLFPQARQESYETGQENQHREERQQKVVGEFGGMTQDFVLISLAPGPGGQFLERQTP
jgi:hypothetical protein